MTSGTPAKRSMARLPEKRWVSSRVRLSQKISGLLWTGRFHQIITQGDFRYGLPEPESGSILGYRGKAHGFSIGGSSAVMWLGWNGSIYPPPAMCQTDRYKPDIGCPQDRIDERELEQTVLSSIRTMAQLVRGAVQAEAAPVRKKIPTHNQRLDRQIKATQKLNSNAPAGKDGGF